MTETRDTWSHAELSKALGQRYRVGDEIGRGGMAVVYRAEDVEREREVAIKVLRPDLSAALAAERFVREIRIAAGLNHPNILPVFDSGSEGSVFFYVMPYVSGESLRDLIAREGQLPLDEAMRITREVADALDYAHAESVVHRDIKPENILLTAGHAVVCDFGIARAVAEAGGERLTRTGVAIGTPAYMSPEQASGDDSVDGRGDQYSLGCMLFEMLAGEPPFGGLTARAVLARQMVEQPPTLEIIRPGLPDSVAIALNTALSKSPADRYATPGEFAVALTDESAVVKKPRKSGDFRLRLAGIGIGIVVTMAGLGLWQMSRPAGVALDPNKVIVFPLVERGGSSDGSEDLGLYAASMLGIALENTEPLRWWDGSLWMLPEERTDPNLFTFDRAREISQARGAAFFIEGALLVAGDSVTVTVRLNDTAGDSLLARESQTAQGTDANTVGKLALSAVLQVLPDLVDPGREIDAAAFEDRDVAATALWYQGERHYRLSRFEQALDLYERALEEDSAFAFAAAKGALAANWLHESDKAKKLVNLAMANESALPARYTAFIRGLSARLAGRPDSAIVWLESALEYEPGWAEVLGLLGEVYYHLLPSVQHPDSVAEVYFEAAITADSGFTPPLYHLAQSAARSGRLERARELADILDSHGAFHEMTAGVRLMLECIDDPDSTDWMRAVELDTSAVISASKALAAAGYWPECAEDGFRTILNAGVDDPDSLGWTGLAGLQGVLISRGRDSAAAVLLDSALATDQTRTFWYYVLEAVAGADLQIQAAAVDSFARAGYGEFYETLPDPQALWILGVWHTFVGDAGRVALISDKLTALADSRGDPKTQLLADAMLGHRAHVEGDTLEAIRRYEALQPVASDGFLAWKVAEPLAAERIMLARLLNAVGRHEEVLSVATIFDHPEPLVYVAFLPESLRLRYESARALGRQELAEEYRRRLERLLE